MTLVELWPKGTLMGMTSFNIYKKETLENVGCEGFGLAGTTISEKDGHNIFWN